MVGRDWDWGGGVQVNKLEHFQVVVISGPLTPEDSVWQNDRQTDRTENTILPQLCRRAVKMVTTYQTWTWACGFFKQPDFDTASEKDTVNFNVMDRDQWWISTETKTPEINWVEVGIGIVIGLCDCAIKWASTHFWSTFHAETLNDDLNTSKSVIRGHPAN